MTWLWLVLAAAGGWFGRSLVCRWLDTDEYGYWDVDAHEWRMVKDPFGRQP